MTRIDPIDPDLAGPRARTLLEGVQKRHGKTPNLLRTLARSPAALEGYLGLSGALGGGSLGATLREQIALTVAGANRCGYCASAHTAVGRKLGLSDEQLHASLRASAGDPKTKAALEFARKVVTRRGWVSDEDLQEIRNAGYDDGEITEIIANVALHIFTNYLNHVAETEVDYPVVEVGEPTPA